MKNVVDKISKHQGKAKIPMLGRMWFTHHSDRIYAYGIDFKYMSMLIPSETIVNGSGGLETSDLKDLMKVKGLVIKSISFEAKQPTKVVTNKGVFTFADCGKYDGDQDLHEISLNLTFSNPFFESEVLKGMVKYVSSDKTMLRFNYVWYQDGSLYASDQHLLRFKEFEGYEGEFYF